MPIEITVPRLGWSMDEGTFGEWVKRDGDFVAAGDPVFLLETEKALQEVESIDEGLLHIIPGIAKEGDTVKVGAIIGYLLAEGEEPPEPQQSNVRSDREEIRHPTQLSAGTERPDAGVSPPADTSQNRPSINAAAFAAPPSVRRLAREHGIDLASLNLTGTISQNDILRAAGERKPAASPQRRHTPLRNSQPSLPRISPRAARTARRFNVDWTQLRGTGRHGRIREQDVLAVSEASDIPHGTLLPASPVRKVIAARLAESLRTTVPVTLTTVACADAILHDRAARKRRATPKDIVPAIHDYMMLAVVKALLEFPALNSHWMNGEILVPDGIHIGLAVDTDYGLTVPVVRDAHLKSLPELAAVSSKLVTRARGRKLTGRECSGGTFTISNPGSFGVGFFTPIINLGESAILGIGAIQNEATRAEDGSVQWSQQMTLSLTFDHQVVDGAPAAQFLQRIGRHVET